MTNVYKNGVVIDKFESPEPDVVNSRENFINVIHRGQKVGKEYRGVDFGRICERDCSVSIESMVQQYSAKLNQYCFWFTKVDGSFGG